MNTWQDSEGLREAGRLHGSFQQVHQAQSPVMEGGKEIEGDGEVEGCEERDFGLRPLCGGQLHDCLLVGTSAGLVPFPEKGFLIYKVGRPSWGCEDHVSSCKWLPQGGRPVTITSPRASTYRTRAGKVFPG